MPDASPIDASETPDAQRPAPCEQDESVVAHRCRPCPGGTTNEPGDDPSGDNTHCDDACSVIDGRPCTTYLKGNVDGPSEGFGFPIDTSGDRMITMDQSGLLTFERRGPSWELIAHLRIPYGVPHLGSTERLLVDNVVFDWSGEGWEESATLTPTDIRGNLSNLDSDISGDTVIIGLPNESSAGEGINPSVFGGIGSSGAAIVFRLVDGVWEQEAIFKARGSRSGLHFGTTVAIDGDIALVGDGFRTVHVYRRGPSGWEEHGRLPGTAWGMSVQSGVVVSTDDSPIATVYEEQDGVWVGLALEAPRFNRFHPCSRRISAISEGGDMIAVGCRDDRGGTGMNPESTRRLFGGGSVHVYGRHTDGWRLLHTFKPNVQDEGDLYGEAVAISGDTVFVGASKEDGNGQLFGGDPNDNSESNTGAIWVTRIPEFLR